MTDASHRTLSHQLQGYGLTTAQIFYRLPDYPSIMQSYIWQEYDLQPLFPELRKFLDFWSKNLEGPLHSVTVAHSQIIGPVDVSIVGAEFNLH